MSRNQEVKYAVDFRAGKPSSLECPDDASIGTSIPRIARLIALAIRFENWSALERFGTTPNWPALAG
jgi:hypothetical protein